MKNLIVYSFIFCSLSVFAQKKKNDKKEEPELVRIQKQMDSVQDILKLTIEFNTKTIDSLKNIIRKKTEGKQTPTKKKVELNLTTTLIGDIQWASSTLGASTKMNLEGESSIDAWLNDHSFVRCEDQVAWNENIDNPSYLVRPGLVGKLGYYFNREAIQKMTSLLESQGQWRIASNTDFNALFKHASLLKLGTYSPFQLLVGNPAIKEMKALCTWKNQSVYDIYGLQITPYSYYSGFDKLLINDNYVEYFSHFSEANEVYVTHISPEDKIEPLAYGYGPEATKYGFFIRLIKI